MSPEDREILKQFINDKCIVRMPPGVYMKGALSDEWYSWQFYLRRVIFDPHGSLLISQWLLNTHKDYTQYAAMETAGPPMLSSLLTYSVVMNRPVHGFAIRKNQKQYGLLNWIEGHVIRDVPVVILDDLANSKSTINRAKIICQSHGIEVSHAKTIVNKSSADHVDGLKVDSIFKLEEFDLKWEDYYENRPEPDNTEFVKYYKNYVYLNIPKKGYVKASDIYT